jgi:hypothetical protein
MKALQAALPRCRNRTSSGMQKEDQGWTWSSPRVTTAKRFSPTQVMVHAPLPAATGIAQSVRGRRHANGSPTAKQSSCRCPIFTSSITLPSELRDVAYQNKRVVFNLLMKAAAETTLTIAADPKRLGARIGITAVLHTWGSTSI